LSDGARYRDFNDSRDKVCVGGGEGNTGDTRGRRDRGREGLGDRRDKEGEMERIGGTRGKGKGIGKERTVERTNRG